MAPVTTKDTRTERAPLAGEGAASEWQRHPSREAGEQPLTAFASQRCFVVHPKDSEAEAASSGLPVPGGVSLSHYPDYLPKSPLKAGFSYGFTVPCAAVKTVSLGDDLGLQVAFIGPAEPGPGDEGQREPEMGHAGPSEGVQLALECSHAWAMVGECEDGHLYAKDLGGRREWCPTCGGKDGLAHQRRKARWMSKARQLRSMGYLVVTIPPELRQQYRDTQELSHLGSRLKEGLQRLGFARGLYRLHWYGEDHDGQDHQGLVPTYHPHWNFILDAGYLESERLDAIKAMVARVLHVSLARVNVYYEYADVVPQMLHILSYVLRPTFLHWEWDEELAWASWAFRNCRSFGHWDDGPVWDVPVDPEADAPSPELVALVAGRCPIDGSPITWRKRPVPSALIREHWRDMGDGYWAWPEPGPWSTDGVYES